MSYDDEDKDVGVSDEALLEEGEVSEDEDDDVDIEADADKEEDMWG